MDQPYSYYHVPELNILADRIAAWRERKGFATNTTNVPEKLALVHSEVSEALEAYRSGGNWVPDFGMELADTIIRILDLTSALGIDIAAEIRNKMIVNENRPHKHGGKVC